MIKLSNLVWLPALTGILLLLAVYIDVNYFNAVPDDVNGSLIREQLIIFIGFISSIIIVVFCIRWLYVKRWRKALYGALSVLIFLICFSVGAIYGGALTTPT